MGQSQEDMNKAVAAWLESHQAYRKYLADTRTLLELFAPAWRGPQRGLSEAFDCYCEALLAENGYSHSEVREVYPPRKPSTD
jgi:hypothetical protein